MENIFEKYYIFLPGGIEYNEGSFELTDESFELFKSLYNNEYGSIYKDENLIEIHTGGWSDNEYLIEEFRKTAWWYRYFDIQRSGGHYYFNTDLHADKDWMIVKKVKTRNKNKRL